MACALPLAEAHTLGDRIERDWRFDSKAGVSLEQQGHRLLVPSTTFELTHRSGSLNPNGRINWRCGTWVAAPSETAAGRRERARGMLYACCLRGFGLVPEIQPADPCVGSPGVKHQRQRRERRNRHMLSHA